MECRKERGGSAGSHFLTSSPLSSLSPLFALPHCLTSSSELIARPHRLTSYHELISQLYHMSSSPSAHLNGPIALSSSQCITTLSSSPWHHHPQLLPVATSPMRLSLFLIASPHRT
ncbi:hypothetical protein F2Q70_00044326 [Brassica cretica]|uniref:Uncharacterized protein n=1 Tax=Brassica cretica TaxID=69181 RepID=A0A8S9LLY6_BRACR|nr:hypothetical protein F2Q70_00044326 [Brassica cretica]KAF2609050.1 hypothetical protein F2Q68_00045286 [Brassica cretica]